uniref:Uncharacterized protein n=1 Tax=Vitis vinifera TaxID=29760 RepID=F6HS94_VITVI
MCQNMFPTKPVLFQSNEGLAYQRGFEAIKGMWAISAGQMVQARCLRIPWRLSG